MFLLNPIIDNICHAKTKGDVFIKSYLENNQVIFSEVSNKLNENIQQSLEELKIVFDWKNLKELYDFLKNTKCKYRVSFEVSKVFSNFRYIHVKY